MSEVIIYKDQPLPLGRSWQVAVEAHVQARSGPAPLIRLHVAGMVGIKGTHATATATVVEGRDFGIVVEFEDPVVPPWDEAMHPALRRKLEKQRTVRSTYVQTGWRHVVEQGLDVRVDSGERPRSGWVLPFLPPGIAVMGELAPFTGWYLLVLRGAEGGFTLEAPAWWGYTDHSPEQAPAGQVQPADGTLVVSLTFVPG